MTNVDELARVLAEDFITHSAAVFDLEVQQTFIDTVVSDLRNELTEALAKEVQNLRDERDDKLANAVLEFLDHATVAELETIIDYQIIRHQALQS